MLFLNYYPVLLSQSSCAQFLRNFTGVIVSLLVIGGSFVAFSLYVATRPDLNRNSNALRMCVTRSKFIAIKIQRAAYRLG